MPPFSSKALAGPALLLCLAWPALARETPATPVSATAVTGVGADYKIGPDDQLDVTVFDVPELSRSVQVDAGGKITMPLIGQLTAAGQTPTQLAELVTADFKQKYVKNPLVTVTVKDAVSERVTVDGAVIQPGIYPLPGPTSLLQAIALAKGPDPKRSEEHHVSLIRLVNGARETTHYDLVAIRAGRAADPAVEARDIIVVPESGSKAFWHGLVSLAPALAMLRP
ncbi:MAG TPA: polysaccharide biosynthesis/export family protein [Caulobacteraceae bacterium]|jgi:polysaccharide export outer membrane protein|nr:polysaccharide biosynthesis/export family protein [Caulobacteraceae bacterium]